MFHASKMSHLQTQCCEAANRWKQQPSWLYTLPEMYCLRWDGTSIPHSLLSISFIMINIQRFTFCNRCYNSYTIRGILIIYVNNLYVFHYTLDIHWMSIVRFVWTQLSSDQSLLRLISLATHVCSYSSLAMFSPCSHHVLTMLWPCGLELHVCWVLFTVLNRWLADGVSFVWGL